MTAQEVITRGMRMMGAIDPGEDPTPKEMSDGLQVLNSLAAFWGSQSWCAPAHVQDSKLLTATDGSYTIGASMDINTTLPTKIVSAWIRDANGFDFPLEIISQEEYAALTDKDVAGQPEKLCFIKSGATGTVLLWPVPDAADTLYIESTKRLGSYALTDPLGLPQEYERPLTLNFAVEYGIEFGAGTKPALAALAAESLTGLKSVNAHPVPRTVTDTMGIGAFGGYNIYTDN